MTKRKIYLKLGILFFGISLIIHSCQKEPFDDFQEQAKEKKLKMISLNEFKSRVGESKGYEKLSKLFDIKKESTTQLGRLEQTDNTWLMTDEIVMVEKEGATFYTFRVGTETESASFYNFIVVMDENSNIISTRILEYVPSNAWLQDTSQPFSGEVKTQENNIFSDGDVDALFLERGSSQCITGVSGAWECSFGNNHGPGECNAKSFDYIVTIDYGSCPPVLTQGEDDGYPIDTTTSGPGGGSGMGGNNNNNNNDDDCVPSIDNPCDREETAVLKPKGDEEEEDDCNTSKKDLKKIFPNASDADMQTLATVINDYGKDFGIDTKEKLQHFLAQAGHEIGEFASGLSQTESLHYTTENRLKTVFKPYFWQNGTDTINKRNPANYLNNSSLVANYVYCCRMGNGNEASGEGYKFRGRGIFQLTGKSNYTSFKTWYNNKYDPDKDFVDTPNLISDNDTISILSALWFYKTNVIDKITIDSTATVEAVTKKVNGGTNGLPHRKEIHTKAKDSIDCR